MNVLHCPGSNLKLGSGIAPIVGDPQRAASRVSLGADGAACNNSLDMFQEMRLAATLQAMRQGPGALPARDVVAMATREGARALGQAGDIGSIETGKKADLIVVSTRGVHQAPPADPYSPLVYASRIGRGRHARRRAHGRARRAGDLGRRRVARAEASRAARTLMARAEL